MNALLRGIVLAAAFLHSCSSVRADTAADLRDTSLARSLLLQDRELEAFNVGVSVRDHVATLWGVVPSAELARRAVDMLKKQPEFREIHSKIVVDPAERPEVEPGSPSKFRPVEPSPPEARPQAALTKGTSTWGAATPRWEPAAQDTPTSAENSPAGPAGGVAAAPETVTVTVRDISLDQAIRTIRESDRRFQGLRHEIRERAVSLTGAVAQWDDAVSLARAISRLPGVERVVLIQIRTPAHTSP
jgi:osmotically-inducible protein OsmY